jgi:hypothetical protein
MIRRRVAPALVALALLGACGDDDTTTDDSPPLTNEFGVETFEPWEDNPWFEPATLEPEAD